MSPLRIAAPVVVLVLIPVLSSCASIPRVPDASGAEASLGVATYRAWLTDETGEVRRFRVQLAAALPDRLHAEVVGPVGGIQVVVDGGGGRACVTIARERRAYVGSADRETMARVFGISLSFEELVSALLVGRNDQTAIQIVRTPADPGLPTTFEVRDGVASLRLERKGRKSRTVSGSRIGNGLPGAGLETAPLETIDGVLEREIAPSLDHPTP